MQENPWTVGMSSRIANLAPIGTLFKRPTPRKRLADLGRDPRERDEEYLASVRQLPCCVKGCRTEPCQAHHIRQPSAAHGKKATPLGQKPDDRWCLPLCRYHHDKCHQGPLSFWYHLNISPVQLCVELYAQRGSLDAMRRVIFEARG